MCHVRGWGGNPAVCMLAVSSYLCVLVLVGGRGGGDEDDRV